MSITPIIVLHWKVLFKSLQNREKKSNEEVFISFQVVSALFFDLAPYKFEGKSIKGQASIIFLRYMIFLQITSK